MIEIRKRLAPLASWMRGELKIFRLFNRKLLGKDHAIIDRYLKANQETKLHLGCGFNVLNHWLNTDLEHSEDIAYLDVTQKFPFSSEIFDYVYSEHMIEHISIDSAERMLKEIFRVIKPGGILRLATPDLVFLIELYSEDKSELQNKYIEWSVERFITHAKSVSDTFVINNFVRDWGHQFIYDEKTLRALLESVGFAETVRCGLNESRHEAFKELVNEGRMPEGFLAMETMVIEARKPE